MNKNSKNVIIGVVVIIVIALIVMYAGKGKSPSDTGTNQNDTNIPEAPVVPVSETTKISGSLSKYENSELGFGIEYPTTWQKADTSNGVQFIVPIDSAQVSTVNRLEVNASVSSGKCTFPPVTKVDSRSTLVVGTNTLNTISMSNTVQGRSYFNRMYSLEKSGVCYSFSFAYVALSPDSKGLTGSNLTQAQNNNKAIKATTDAAFTAMVKSLTFLTSASGVDETKAVPIKK